MSDGLKYKLIILFVIILIVAAFLTFYIKLQINQYTESYEKSQSAVIRAVVIRVNENGLNVMSIENSNELYNVGYSSERNIGFKQGQEILIYFNGIVMDTYPLQLGNAYKIEIVKEKSDVEIPEKNLKFYYSSRNNVNVSINELIKTGMTLTITDKNELPYDYTNKYVIYKKEINEDYKGEGEKIGNDTENSTSGYTGTGVQYVWKELEKISDVSCESTVESLIYNLPYANKDNQYSVIGRKFNWISLYGELKERRI